MTNCNNTDKRKVKQAMISLSGMAEHKFSNVYTNAKLFFYEKKNRKLANIRPSLHYYGMIIWLKTKPLCIGMGWLPLQKLHFDIGDPFEYFYFVLKGGPLKTLRRSHTDKRHFNIKNI